ncbi:MAG: cyclic nucleotide-binding domain-containing protein [Spirochaetes bacterium]|nr:cyclic nucleotide-binding domain-containing protein [Spirochaetota bacterium]
MGNVESVDFDFLRRCSLFGGLTETALEHICTMMLRQRFSAGGIILSEGSVNDRIYFIEHGRVEIAKAGSSEGKPVNRHIVDMASGDTFGEMELIDIQPCEATVRAVEDTVTLSLSNRDLYLVSKFDMKTYALLIMNLARDLSRRLRHTDFLLAKGGSCGFEPGGAPPESAGTA